MQTITMLATINFQYELFLKACEIDNIPVSENNLSSKLKSELFVADFTPEFSFSFSHFLPQLFSISNQFRHNHPHLAV